MGKDIEWVAGPAGGWSGGLRRFVIGLLGCFMATSNLIGLPW